jgi:hypothetical protein
MPPPECGAHHLPVHWCHYYVPTPQFRVGGKGGEQGGCRECGDELHTTETGEAGVLQGVRVHVVHAQDGAQSTQGPPFLASVPGVG